MPINDLDKELDEVLNKKAQKAKESAEKERKRDIKFKRLDSIMQEFLRSVVNPALEDAKSMFEKRKMHVTLELDPSSRYQVFPYKSEIEIVEPNTNFKYTIRVDQAGDSFGARAWIFFANPKTNKATQKERNLPPSGISKDDILADIVHAYAEVNS